MKNFVLCFTGISGSGKTTLANYIDKYLKKKGITCQVIDGDKLRNELGNLFGYTKEERMKNSRVVQVLAKYLNNNGINVIIAIVAPYNEMREQIRNFIGKNYIEVYIDCPYKICSERDVKGYYKKQREGKMENLNGANDIFEIPINSELIIYSDKENADVSGDKIINFLIKYNYIDKLN